MRRPGEEVLRLPIAHNFGAIFAVQQNVAFRAYRVLRDERLALMIRHGPQSLRRPSLGARV